MSVQSEINRIKANIAAAFTKIGEKGGSVPAAKTSSNLASAIASIPAGTDTSDATAAAGDILSGKTAYVKGAKVSGSMAKVTQTTPSITVSSAGLITAQATQTAGYVVAGTKSATQQLTTQAAQTITPGTADQSIASGRYLTGVQTIKGDVNLAAENIKKGVSIFGVEGSLEGGAATLRIRINSANVSLEKVEVFQNGGFVAPSFSAAAGAIEFHTEGCALITASISGSGSSLAKPKTIAINIAGGVYVGYTSLANASTPIGTTIQNWIIQPASDQVTITLADASSIGEL